MASKLPSLPTSVLLHSSWEKTNKFFQKGSHTWDLNLDVFGKKISKKNWL